MGTFTYDGANFFRNGKEHRILSGAMHYFRVPRAYWNDRLRKLKECGFNTVETYIPWNLHEPEEGVYDFSEGLDLCAYLEEAGALGLDVILRPGPYICAEWEFGGLPAWLLRKGEMPLRCSDEAYLGKVRRYFAALLPRLRPYLFENGGNVVMLQIENEYGSYGNDQDYLCALREMYRENGMKCLYFTSDGACSYMLGGGGLPDELAVANFGSRPRVNLSVLARHRPQQPLMCGEYWCGWFDHWFEAHHVRTPDEICGDFEEFFQIGASVNFYMFHGGTNFGFMNGANYDQQYAPTVTSYDYNALLTEAGDRTPAYYCVREMMQRYLGEDAVPPLTARESEKAAYGDVALSEVAPLFENLSALSAPVRVAAPRYMEEIGQNYGYTLYRTTLPGRGESRRLVMEEVHDRAEIFLDGKPAGVYARWAMPAWEEQLVFDRPIGTSVQLDILCENMGRVNYGPHLCDRKGIHGVRLDGQYHFGWEMYPLPMTDLSRLSYRPLPADTSPACPAFLRGKWQIAEEPRDTFLLLDGFQKGFVMVNGHNLGRYFNAAGPQKTLYVPAPFLIRGENEIVVFESDGTDRLTVTFLDRPILG